MTSLYLDVCQSRQLAICDTHRECISARLAAYGVHYRHLSLPAVDFDAVAERDEIIDSYLTPLNEVLQFMPCASLEVLSVLPSHPRMAFLQRQFMTEHAHDVAEAQLLVRGSGILFVRVDGTVFALDCDAGDFVWLPAGLYHWFDMNPATGFRTIRLFAGEAGHTFSRRPVATRGRDMRGVYRPIDVRENSIGC